MLLRMRSAVSVGALLVAISGCQMGPTTPIPAAPTTVAGPPASINLTVISGVGADAAKASVAATVHDASGQAVGSTTVTFASSIGTVQPAAVTTDSLGLAQTLVVATAGQPVTITATAGAASATRSITLSSGAGTSGSGTFTLSMSADPATVGSASVLKASLLNATFPLSSAVWTFGDGQTLTNTTYAAQHTYAGAGTYPATVTITDGQGRVASGSGSVVVNAVASSTPTPTAPDPNAWSVGLTCTTSTLTAYCTTTATSGSGTAIASNRYTTSWDWGDGQIESAVQAPQNSHKYQLPGTYNVVVTANTVSGSGTGTATKSVTVTQ